MAGADERTGGWRLGGRAAARAANSRGRKEKWRCAALAVRPSAAGVCESAGPVDGRSGPAMGVTMAVCGCAALVVSSRTACACPSADCCGWLAARPSDCAARKRKTKQKVRRADQRETKRKPNRPQQNNFTRTTTRDTDTTRRRAQCSSKETHRGRQAHRHTDYEAAVNSNSHGGPSSAAAGKPRTKWHVTDPHSLSPIGWSCAAAVCECLFCSV